MSTPPLVPESLEPQRLLAIILRTWPLPKVVDANPHDYGVFETSRDDSRYVPRSRDAEIEHALADRALMTVVVGDANAGKSRAAFEGLRSALGDHWLIAPSPPGELEAQGLPSQPLGLLLGLDSPVPFEDDSGYVVWLDDVDEYILAGDLTRDHLGQLVAIYPEVMIVCTIRSERMDAFTDTPAGRSMATMLRGRRREIVLDVELDQGELAAAAEIYEEESRLLDFAQIGRFFSGADLVLTRFRFEAGRKPSWRAVARSAVNWRRAGMVRHIDDGTLRFLASQDYHRLTGDGLTDADYESAREWARESVGESSVKLLYSAPGADDHFFISDFVLAWATVNDPPLTPESWNTILLIASGEDELGLGFAAYQAGQYDVAAAAWKRLAYSTNPANMLAAWQLSIVSQQMADREGAAEAVQRALELRDDPRADIFGLGEPAGVVSETEGGVHGTETELLHFTIDDESGNELEILPLWSRLDYMREAQLRNPDWQSLHVLEINIGELMANRDRDVIVVFDPWSEHELHKPARDEDSRSDEDLPEHEEPGDGESRHDED